MAKELPYFRFTVQDWQNGKIDLERFELKGLFIDLCGYYWINDCHLTLAMLHKKFSNAKALVNELIELGIIKHENRHDKVEIDFLNKQYDLLSEKRKLRQSAGSKGGNAKAMLKQKGSYKDKDKDNNKDKDKDNRFDFKLSLLDYGFLDNLVNEWLVIRKNKKASNTETAFNGFVSQVELTGLDKNEVLKTCVERSWSGLKAEWIKTNTQISKVDQLLIAHEEGKKLLGINEPTNENK